ncbi:TPA: GPO family capsid scaffolding protein, partial [Escherichia coli]|nr:GPO family capsid scaffolding protein [Escherichia coli]
EVIELTERRSEEGAQWLNRVMNMIGRGRRADDTRFSRIHDAVEGIASSHADLLDRFSALESRHQADRQKIATLSTELAELKNRLRGLDADQESRFTATGGQSRQLADY